LAITVTGKVIVRDTNHVWIDTPLPKSASNGGKKKILIIVSPMRIVNNTGEK
jgi:hypothetical protein